ncbi:hypothetical protein RJ641_000718 [Dillenia turbinata]|uniref:Profilin n=1 Tax=Dillenia turbinata TaxID=194707 RepID=A0AAN8W8P3_9MAGN
MDWTFVRKAWEKWASPNIGSTGEPLKAALLLNYDPTGPSRLLSTIIEQEGMKANPMEMNQIVDFVKRNNLQFDTFIIGTNQSRTRSCLRYEGSIGSASRAMVVVDQFAWQLGQRNL